MSKVCLHFLTSHIKMHKITQLAEVLFPFVILCFVLSILSVCACVGHVVDHIPVYLSSSLYNHVRSQTVSLVRLCLTPQT